MQTARWKSRKSGSRNYGDDVANCDMQAVDIIDGSLRCGVRLPNVNGSNNIVSIEGVVEGCGPG